MPSSRHRLALVTVRIRRYWRAWTWLAAMTAIVGCGGAATSMTPSSSVSISPVAPAIATERPTQIPPTAPAADNLASAVMRYFDDNIALGTKCVALWQTKDVASLMETTCIGEGLLIDNADRVVLAKLLQGPAPAGYGKFALATDDAFQKLSAFAVNIKLGSQYLKDGYGPGEHAEP
jgi:hypothetical protein